MRHAPTLLAKIALLAALLAGRAASADDPVEARLLTAPTAWLPPAGAVTASVAFEPSVDARDDGAVIVGYGLGGLAAVELAADTEVRTCTRCDEPANARWFARASFRLGTPQDTLVRGMPALALGVKNTIGTPGLGFGVFERPRVTEAYLVASRDLVVVRLHAGAMAIAAAFGDFELAPVIRPIAGIELRPPTWPRSSFLADIGWSTRLEAEAEPSERRGPRPEMMIGGGARFQFFTWASIELGVRFPQEEGIAGGKILVRLNGVWELATPQKRRLKLR
jgi:hypothetical protein